MELAAELGGDDARRPRAPQLCEVRSHHRTGQGVHRAAGRGRRPLCARAGRTRTESGRRSTTTTSRRAWTTRFRDDRTGRSSRSPTSSIRCAAASRVGLIPTGSRDPFALRRAAQGVVKILVEGKLRSRPRRPARRRTTRCRSSSRTASATTSANPRLRVRRSQCRAWPPAGATWWTRGAPGARAARCAPRRISSRWPPASSASRTSRAGGVQRRRARRCGLLEAGPEQRLYEEFRARSSGAAASRYARSIIASLRPKVDLFFDKVLVNAPDARVRQNRLTLLNTLLAEFSTIADFSEIVTQFIKET